MKVVDLFCGCGGLSLGFINSGFEVVSAYDYWDSAIQCYNENFSHKAAKLDISDFNLVAKELNNYQFDMIIGGPPCQDFSSAGNRIEGNRAELSKDFARVVTHFKPQWFVMENVSRFSKTKTYEEVIKTYRKAGYGLTIAVLNASHFGVPQRRKRLFCIGKIGANDGFLDDIIYSFKNKRELSVYEYLQNTYGSNIIGVDSYYRHPRSYKRRAIFSIHEPAPTIRGINRPKPNGYKRHKNDFGDENIGVRALSTRERAVLQTFPYEFALPSNKTEAEQMIGNAVPVKLSECIASSIFLYNSSIT